MSSKFIEYFKNKASKKDIAQKEKELLSKIEEAFVNQEFKMYLQFIVDSNNKITSAEALSRWENGKGEIVSPVVYIGLMEKSGFIIKLDYYMFEKVCQKLAAWKGTEFDGLTISCNFTRITISEENFIDKIKKIADKYDFCRKNLLIEITEDSTERNIKTATENVSKVKELGFRVALDDVGRGYTSLMCLCEYPVDIVKVDRDILLLAKDERGRKLLFGIIRLAHYLNLEVVCEGVETEEQNSMVLEGGCDYIQGWYYSKALSEQKAEEFAKEYMSKCQAE